jgi:hypothetical protein
LAAPSDALAPAVTHAPKEDWRSAMLQRIAGHAPAE